MTARRAACRNAAARRRPARDARGSVARRAGHDRTAVRRPDRAAERGHDRSSGERSRRGNDAAGPDRRQLDFAMTPGWWNLVDTYV